MNDDDKIRDLLKQSLGQTSHDLERDLWPQMLRRLDEQRAAVPWFDWALLVAVGLGLFWIPSAIPLLLYHL
ncbi:MAG: hypothetical protein ACRD3L_18775 [Terriglobales bacterium]